MQTFYAKTFRDFKNTFHTPKSHSNSMPLVKRQSLRSKAFSQIFIPHYEKVPPRELYDRDSFETDQYSKMLYVESKMDRLIKRHRQTNEKQQGIKKNIHRRIRKRGKDNTVNLAWRCMHPYLLSSHV